MLICPFVRHGGKRVCALLCCLGASACSDDAPADPPESTTGGSSSTGTRGDPSDTTTGDSSTSSSTGSSEGSTTQIGSSTGEEPPPRVPGLRGQYYSDYHDLTLVRVEETLQADWGDTAPDPAVGADHFSARWTGWLTAPHSGTYTIITETDDGVRVVLDDQVLIEDWTPQYVERNEAQVQLFAGQPVPIVVEYFEIDLQASVRLAWSQQDIPEQTIPQSALSTLEAPDEQASPKPPYQNPVVPFDCPDPGVIAVLDAEMPGYYMVCTGGSFPIRYSRDLVRWHETGTSILPAGQPSWADNGFRNWAPEIHRVGDQFVAYFTTADDQNRLCIGYATADDILGPYTESPGPLVQDPAGVIDATYFEAEGTRWLFYKIDGNAQGNPTPNFVRELSEDGLSFAAGSQPVQVIVNDPMTWEAGVLEALYLTEHDGMYYMFYSGNVYDYRYRTGVARASSITGPWEKHGEPILASNDEFVGPGHGTVLHVDGRDWFFYHAWRNAGNGTHVQELGRHGMLDPIDWVDGWPRIQDGTPGRGLQPWPGDD